MTGRAKAPTFAPRPEQGPAVRCGDCGNQYRNGKRCPYCGTPIPFQPALKSQPLPADTSTTSTEDASAGASTQEAP